MADHSDPSTMMHQQQQHEFRTIGADATATAAADIDAENNSSYTAVVTAMLVRLLGHFVDNDYSSWMWHVLWPVSLTFLLPLVFVMLIYLSSLFLYIYKLHR